MSEGIAPRQGILSLTIRDKSALYAAYMPFVNGGGLFIPTKKGYRLGEEVFMLLTLMDEGGQDSGGRQDRLDNASGCTGQPCGGYRRAVQRPG